MPRDKEGSAQGHEGSGMMRWLLTYADMITLLLAFFIVLYSIAKVDQAKYSELARQLQAIFTGQTGVLESGQVPLPDQGNTGDSMALLIDLLRDYVSSLPASADIHIDERESRVTLRLADALLFPSGEDSLTPQALEILAGLSAILDRFPNDIRIEGFTDNVPISNAHFDSNWHLSAARAASVALYLVERGLDPTRLTAAGYGEYRPMVPNDTSANRQLNRRVDIVVLGDEL